MKKFLSSSLYNGLSGIYSMLFIVAWYYLVVKFNDDSHSANLLLWLSLASITSLADFGASTAIIGMLPKLEEAEKGKFILSILPFYGLYMISVSVIAYLVVSYFEIINPLGEYFFAPLILLSFSSQIYLFGISILRGYLSFKAVSIFNIVNTTTTYGFSILGFYYYKNIYSGFIVLSCFSFLSVIILYFYLSKYKKINFRFELSGYSNFKNVLLKGTTFFPQIFVGFFFTHVIRFVAGFTLGASAVKIVSFSFSIASRIHTVFNSFIEVLYPLISSRNFTINLFLLQKYLWFFFILFYLPSVFIIAHYLNAEINGIEHSTILFCLGTWLSIQLAPYFHYFNSQDGSILISRLSLLSLFLYLLILGLSVCIFQITIDSFSTSYLITNIIIYFSFVYWLNRRLPQTINSTKIIKL